MNNDFMPFCVGIFLGIIPGMAIGGYCQKMSDRIEAVQHNAAYYSTNQLTGSYQFHWKEPNVNERSAEQAD